MKRILLYILLIIPTSLYSQFVDSSKVKWYGEADDRLTIDYNEPIGITFSDSIVSISIIPDANRRSVYVSVYNRNSDRISIKWNESTIGRAYSSSRILFTSMRMFQINDPIPNSTIYPNTSFSKEIIGQDCAENPYMVLVDLKKMKKDFSKSKTEQKETVNLILLINDNEQDYVYNLKLIAKYSK